jgi:hypothetical protein
VQDSYLRPPGHKAGVTLSAKAKDRRRRPFLGAPWAGSRACAEPSRAEFADRKRGWLRQHCLSGLARHCDDACGWSGPPSAARMARDRAN